MSSIVDFYNKHKMKIMMLSPVAIGIVFFVYSSVSALCTISSVKIPDNFNEISVKVKNYETYEMYEGSNSLKWTLNAKFAESDAAQTKAKIKDAVIKVFDKEKVKFVIKSDYALVNKGLKKVDLYDNVNVVYSEGGFVLDAGELKYQEDSSDLKVSSSWVLKSKEGYEVKGTEGIISKDFESVISKGNASVERDGLNLKANEITLDKQKPIIANGNASLKIDQEKSLKADSIIVNHDGSIRATGHVNVKTDKVSCFSNRLEIVSNSDKSPKLAIFRGSPYIIQNGKTIFADTVTYDFNLDQVTIEGNVHTKS